MLLEKPFSRLPLHRLWGLRIVGSKENTLPKRKLDRDDRKNDVQSNNTPAHCNQAETIYIVQE